MFLSILGRKNFSGLEKKVASKLEQENKFWYTIPLKDNPSFILGEITLCPSMVCPKNILHIYDLKIDTFLAWGKLNLSFVTHLC